MASNYDETSYEDLNVSNDPQDEVIVIDGTDESTISQCCQNLSDILQTFTELAGPICCIIILCITRIMIYKGMFYKSKYWILEKI